MVTARASSRKRSVRSPVLRVMYSAGSAPSQYGYKAAPASGLANRKSHAVGLSAVEAGKLISTLGILGKSRKDEEKKGPE